MEIKQATLALAALAQETRLAIFRLLVEAGPEGVPAGQISELLEVPAATLSFHLKELAHAGLAHARPAGRFMFYSADFERMAGLMTFLTQNCCRGMPEQCLTTVETALARCCPAPVRSAPERSVSKGRPGRKMAAKSTR
jgi:ArsR family transcriptional regulator